MIIENGSVRHEPVEKARETEQERRERLSEEAWQTILMLTDDPEIQEYTLYIWVGIPHNIIREVLPSFYDLWTLSQAVWFVKQNLPAVKKMAALAEERGILPYS